MGKSDRDRHGSKETPHERGGTRCHISRSQSAMGQSPGGKSLIPSALDEELAGESNRIRLNVRVRSAVEKLRNPPRPYRLGIVEISL